jgi:hypothetical protein
MITVQNVGVTVDKFNTDLEMRNKFVTKVH